MNQVSASSYLEPAIIDYLESKADSNEDGRVTFERSELNDHLIKKFRANSTNTEGARTGTLNRLFESDSRITKISHGKYIFQQYSDTLTTKTLISELKNTLQKVDSLTNGITFHPIFTNNDRRIIYNVQYTVDCLTDLIQKIEATQDKE